MVQTVGLNTSVEIVDLSVSDVDEDISSSSQTTLCIYSEGSNCVVSAISGGSDSSVVQSDGDVSAGAGRCQTGSTQDAERRRSRSCCAAVSCNALRNGAIEHHVARCHTEVRRLKGSNTFVGRTSTSFCIFSSDGDRAGSVSDVNAFTFSQCGQAVARTITDEHGAVGCGGAIHTCATIFDSNQVKVDEAVGIDSELSFIEACNTSVSNCGGSCCGSKVGIQGDPTSGEGGGQGLTINQECGSECSVVSTVGVSDQDLAILCGAVINTCATQVGADDVAAPSTRDVGGNKVVGINVVNAVGVSTNVEASALGQEVAVSIHHPSVSAVGDESDCVSRAINSNACVTIGDVVSAGFLPRQDTSTVRSKNLVGCAVSSRPSVSCAVRSSGGLQAEVAGGRTREGHQGGTYACQASKCCACGTEVDACGTNCRGTRNNEGGSGVNFEDTVNCVVPSLTDAVADVATSSRGRVRSRTADFGRTHFDYGTRAVFNKQARCSVVKVYADFTFQKVGSCWALTGGT